MNVKEKLFILSNLKTESNEEIIKNVILNIYFPSYSYFKQSELNLVIRYKKFTFLKLLFLPKKLYKKYYLILLHEENKIYKSISYKERKTVGELLNKIIFKDIIHSVQH